LLGRRVEWPPRRVDRLAVWLGFVGEWESLVRCGVGRTAWGLAAVFGVGLVSGVFGVGGGWALVSVLNLVMGVPLKVAVACSEVAIALGDAAVATYLSAGFRPDFLVSTQEGRVGGFSGGVGCGVWRGSCGWWFWGVCFSPRLRRDLQKASRRHLVGGGRLSWARRSGFSSRCLWRPPFRRRCGVEIGAAALLALFLVASAAWRSTGLAAVCRSCRVGWRWGDFCMRRRLREG
jgi:hypothetical protein